MDAQGVSIRERLRGVVGGAQARLYVIEGGAREALLSVRTRYGARPFVAALRADLLTLRDRLAKASCEGLALVQKQADALRARVMPPKTASAPPIAAVPRAAEKDAPPTP